MPKPFYGISGSGLHIHQQLVATSDSANAFSDAHDARYGLTPTARHFIAGQLAHARAICAILCPLVNSYKRLVPGFEAPTMVDWGRVNRDALIRVPRTAAGVARGTRVELRCADPSCNPYLALAVMLHTGIEGIASELAAPPPVEESLVAREEPGRLLRQGDTLPATLGEALDALRADEVVRAALGDLIADWFIEAKAQEWHDYQRQVHPWERDRYLATF
jgi:glutamine synthetase